MIDKQKLEKLYKSGLSMKEISGKTGWSYRQVVYWMNQYDIPRRSWSEATYIKRNPEGDPFDIKTKLTPEERELKGFGLGLYWGEGDKAGNASVRLGNVDPDLIRRFIEFLVKICGVKTDKLKYELHLFNDINRKSAIDFWKNKLSIKEKDFSTILSYPSRGDGTYKKKCQVGVLTVCCHNKKLKEKIIEMLR